MTADTTAIARRMKAAQDSVQQLDLLTSQYDGFDVSDAYEVASLVHAMRLAEGARPMGRKIGFTNPDMWSLYGVREPIWGYMYDMTVTRLSPGAKCPLGRFTEPKIEPEIAFHFHYAPPAGGDLAAILDCIDWVAHGFEIVQSHYPGWNFRVADTVADGSLHGTLLLGEQTPVDSLGDDPVDALQNFALTLFRGNEPCATGKGSNVLGSPLAAIAHLVAVLANQPRQAPLGAGEIVTTGTITTAQPVCPGETWRTELVGIGLSGLSVELVD